MSILKKVGEIIKKNITSSSVSNYQNTRNSNQNVVKTIGNTTKTNNSSSGSMIRASHNSTTNGTGSITKASYNSTTSHNNYNKQAQNVETIDFSANYVKDITTALKQKVDELKTNSKNKFDFEKAYNLSNSAKVINAKDNVSNWNEFVSSLANSKYGSVDGFNKAIKNNVLEAGYGTVNGVLAAIKTLAYDYPEATGKKFFYTSDFGITMRKGTDGIIPNVTNLDCRAFVQWSVYNGGYNADMIAYRTNEGGFQDWGKSQGIIMDDIKSAKPGDIFSGDGDGGDHGGHIWMVVDNYSDGYYVAEEFGDDKGLVINRYSFDEHEKEVERYKALGYDMQGYYNNIENIRDVDV